MRRLVPLLLLVASCARPSPPDPPTVTVATPTSAPGASATSARPLELCERLVAEELSKGKQILASARQRALEAKEKDLAEALGAKPPELLARCWAGARGAWITTLSSVKTESGWGAELQFRWTLDFVDTEGRRSSVTPSQHEKLSEDGYNLTLGGPESNGVRIVSFDFDGDGTPEIFVRFEGRYHEGESFAVGRLYTAGRGAVEPYAPSVGIAVSGLRDADGDGRPDLVTSPFAAVAEACASGFGYRVAGPTLIAHALPGGAFAQGDEVAVAEARKACPARPGRIVAKGHEGETGEGVMNVACARIWGASAEAVKQQIGRECKPPPASDPCAPGSCLDGDLLRGAADKVPPLVLRY